MWLYYFVKLPPSNDESSQALDFFGIKISGHVSTRSLAKVYWYLLPDRLGHRRRLYLCHSRQIVQLESSSRSSYHLVSCQSSDLWHGMAINLRNNCEQPP